MRIVRKNTEKWYIEVFEYLCSLYSDSKLPNNKFLNETPRRLIRKVLRLGVFKAPYPYKWMSAKIKYDKTVSSLSPLRRLLYFRLYGNGVPYCNHGNKLFWNTILRIRASYRLMKLICGVNKPLRITEIQEMYRIQFGKVATLEEFSVTFGTTVNVYHVKQFHYEQSKFMTLIGNVLFVYSYNQRLYRYELRDYGVVCDRSNVVHVADEYWLPYTSEL